MSIENWPAMPITPAMGAPCKTELAVRAEALGARLRTADEALRLYVAWCEAETTYVPTFYERMAMCAEAEHAARAYLAAREKER